MPYQPPLFSADTSSHKIYTALREDGCAVIESVASKEQLKLLRDELRPHLDQTKYGVDEFAGEATRRVHSVVRKSEVGRDLIANELVLHSAERVILENNSALQLHFASLIAIGPGETAQPVHRDQVAWDNFPFPPDHQILVNCMWAITDFTEANGATRIVPRSHRLENGLDLRIEDTVPIVAPAGSVAMFVGSLYHAGGSNLSSSERLGLSIGYSANWLRQEENQYLAVPLDLARELPERMQRLIGYNQLYSLGFVDQYTDVIDILR